MINDDGGPSDLVPLRTDFDVVWHGYRRDEVRHYVRAVESEIRLLISDRDGAASRVEALARQIESLRSENDDLRAQIDRISGTPIDADGLSERLRRMLELARDEAAEITARAEVAAEGSWAAAGDTAARFKGRYERLIAEFDSRRREMEAEHRELMRRMHAEVEATTRKAERRRHELDEQATRRHREVERDFEIAMATRRAEAQRQLDERDAAAKAEAERLVREATEEAHRLVAEARQKADELLQVRDGVADRLHAALEALADAAPLLEPQPGETDPRRVPRQRASSPALDRARTL